MTVRVYLHGSTVRVEVDDESPEFPVLAQPDDASALHGRGLVLVDALASDWGTRPNERGKTVWFELDAKAAMAIETEDA
jgi:hypothetical protein